MLLLDWVMAQPPLSPHLAEEAEPDLIVPPCPPPRSRLAKRQLICDPPVFRERHHVWVHLAWCGGPPRGRGDRVSPTAFPAGENRMRRPPVRGSPSGACSDNAPWRNSVSGHTPNGPRHPRGARRAFICQILRRIPRKTCGRCRHGGNWCIG